MFCPIGYSYYVPPCPWAYVPAPCVALVQQHQQPLDTKINKPKNNKPTISHQKKNKPKKNKPKKNKPKKNKPTTSHHEKTLQCRTPADNLDHAMNAKFNAAKSRTLMVTAAFTVFMIGEPLSLVANGLRADVACFLAHDALHHGKALALWPALILSAFPELSTLSLDLMLVSLVMTCLRNRADVNSHGLHDFVEYSAGSGMLTLQCLIAGLSGIGLDKIYNTGQDNATSNGLRLWIKEMTVTKRGSLNWFGSQCSSFSALCRNGAQRWPENLYWGDEARAFVRDGNMQMVITALLMMLSFWCNNVPVLEQPMSSTMPLLPPLSAALNFMKATRVVTWNKAFGSASMKPLQILSSSDIIQCLKRPKPGGRSISLATSDSSGAFTGNKKRLRQSQVYTEMFGRCVADMAKAHLTAVSGSAVAV